MFIVDPLQMFRQQLLVTDYDHMRETCKLVEPLAAGRPIARARRARPPR